MKHLVLLVALASCVDDPEQPETIAKLKSDDPCPSYGCGENSPIMGPYHLDELNVDGVENTDHVTIVEVVHPHYPGHKFRIEMQGDRMTAVDVADPHLVLSTSKYLPGAEIHLNVANPDGTQTAMGIRIDRVIDRGVSVVKFWQGAPDSIETYVLSGLGNTEDLKVPVCAHKSPTVDEGAWNSPMEALLFTGDRYDPTKKRVTASDYKSSAGWFNIACAGSVTAKLHLNRHTTASGGTTTRAARQALLKMYAGDFCGDGTVYTVAGTPLYWKSNAGQHNLLTALNAHSYEALWNENGAMCLDKHRLSDVSKEYEQAIAASCPKHACEDLYPSFPTMPRDAYLETMSSATP